MNSFLLTLENVDATFGGYYTSLVSAVQTAFASLRDSEETLITTAISKENSFNTSVLGLSTTYATAEINADYAYYNALINSHASELQTALTNEQSLIAAEVACYRAFSDAAFTRDSSVVTANADAARRQLTFTEAYGNQLWGTLWGGLPGLDLSSNLTVRTVSANPLGVDSAALLNLVPISYVTPEDPEDEAPNYWSTFNTSIMDALDTANGSYRAAVGASDLSAAIESYQNAYYDTDATLNSSVASAFGTFQIGVRQDRLAGVTLSNPRYAAYAGDVTWSTQTKSLRDQRVTQYNEDRNEYVEAVVAAQKNYNVNGEKPVVRLVVGETRKAPAKALAFAGAYHLVAIRNASF